MSGATATTRTTTETTGKSVPGALPATLRSTANRRSHCYIRRETCKINRQPRRLEIIVNRTKQTPITQFNRQLFGTREKRFHRAISSHSPLTTSHCLFHRTTAFRGAQATGRELQHTNHAQRPSLVAPSSRRTCQGAKKQQNRRSLHLSLGLYFLASYAHFPIGRQRALVHNGGTELAAGYNDKKIHTALVGMEPSREHQSVIR